MIHIDLFAGMGGFSIAAHQMGWKHGVTCEINPFCQNILRHWFPQAYHHADIHTLDHHLINEELTKRHGPDWGADGVVCTLGFPCPPVSTAGKRLGTDDPRWLWPEGLRIVSELRPSLVVAENVRGIVSIQGGLVFEQVCLDLENLGYSVQAFIVPAAGINAPHKRERVWFVAHSRCESARWGKTDEQGFRDGHRDRHPKRKEASNLLDGFVETGTFANPNQLNGHGTGFRPSQVPFEQTTGIQDRVASYPFGNGGIQQEDERGSVRDQNRDGEGEERGRHDIQIGIGGRLEIKGFDYWGEFPTQSPLRSGNDGFSALLDPHALLDPKKAVRRDAKKKALTTWRRESIKAGGNAIVPYLALEIFRAYEETENIHGRNT